MQVITFKQRMAAPAGHRGNKRSFGKAWVAALYDPANRVAFKRGIQFERRDIAFAFGHATAHIGIDRHPDIFNQDFPVKRIWQDAVSCREVFRGGNAIGVM